MTPNQLIPILEGLVGTGLRAALAPQRVILWLETLKTVLRSQGLRDATDFDIVATNDSVNADTVFDASGGTMYGALVDSIFDVGGEDLITLIGASGGSFTLDATTFDFGSYQNEGLACIKCPVAADTSNAEFGTWIDPQGQVCPTDIHVASDGEEGTAPTSLDVRVWLIYRTSTEVRV